MCVKQEWELAAVLVSAVCAVVVRVLGLKVRLVLLKPVVPLGMSAVAVNMVRVGPLNQVLENEELAAFGNVERLQADVSIEHFVAVPLVFGVIAWPELSHFAVLLVHSVLDTHAPLRVPLTAHGSTSALANDAHGSFCCELKDIPACA